jgi:hypothetical protein
VVCGVNLCGAARTLSAPICLWIVRSSRLFEAALANAEINFLGHLEIYFVIFLGAGGLDFLRGAPMNVRLQFARFGEQFRSF